MKFTPLKIIILSIFLAIIGFAFAAGQQPLPLEKAFSLSVKPTNTDSIVASWQIAPGYYLYKDRFDFKVESPKDASIGFIIKPQGIEKDDDILGKHYVYENHVDLSIPILNPTKEPLRLLVSYQGCAEWGFCYPPVTKLVTIVSRPQLTANDIKISEFQAPTKPATVAKIAEPKAPIFHSEQDKAEGILAQKSWLFALLLFFGFGLLLAFTPCVLPMIPILSGIIVGHGEDLKTKHAFLLSLAYVLGMAVAFAIAGLIVGLLGSSVQAALQAPWVLTLFSLLFVLLALSLFGFYDLQLPQSWQQKINDLSKHQKAHSLLGVAVMGALSTLIVSPCVSAPLVGALAYIGNTGDALFGGLALFFMGLGMGLPLLIVGTTFGKLLPKAGKWMNAVKQFFGVLLLGVAIWMLDRILPGSLILALWACLAIVTSIYMGALCPATEKKLSRLWKGLGLALLLYGFLLLIGAAMGNQDPLQPLAVNAQNQTSSANHKTKFIPIKSLADLNQQLTLNKGKLVMLDFYADWCVACKEMEIHTFQNPEVTKALQNYVVLQADVTANDAMDKALEKHFGVIAPPTILFFNKDGKEIKNARIVGEMKAQEFLSHLNKVQAMG